MVRLAASLAMLILAAGCSNDGLPANPRARTCGGSKTSVAPDPGSGGRPGAGGEPAPASQSTAPKGGAAGAPASSGGGAGATTTSSATTSSASTGSASTGSAGTGSASSSGGARAVTTGTGGGVVARGGSTTASSGTGGGGGSLGGAPGKNQDCASLPPVTDYGAPGPFHDARMFTAVGPNNNYTLFRPDATLGQNGFLHPIAAWGNGISTTPDMYQKTLPLIASHGFVIIACNDTQVEQPCLSSGLDWLIQQNSTAGPLQGKLDTAKEVLVGYSWGGGASIDTAVRPNVKAVVSLHGMPPRQSPWGSVHAPILLFTSTGDNFVTPSGYVTPNYEASTVQTFYATLNDSTAGHLYVVDEWAAICIGSLVGSKFGNCGNAELEHAPTIAWLRMLACGDAAAKRFFYGDNCVLCGNPWTNPQRKNWP